MNFPKWMPRSRYRDVFSTFRSSNTCHIADDFNNKAKNLSEKFTFVSSFEFHSSLMNAIKNPQLIGFKLMTRNRPVKK